MLSLQAERQLLEFLTGSIGSAGDCRRRSAGPLRGEGRGLMSQSGQEETADVAPGAAQSAVNISSSTQGAGLLGRDCHGARVNWSPR